MRVLILLVLCACYISIEAGCPSDCTGSGICGKDGKCICLPQFSGADCSIDECESLNKCNGNGVCKFGKCFCEAGFEGDACESEISCPEGDSESICNGNGLCERGKCFCFPGWEGDACLTASTCSKDCHGHGLCNEGSCYCEDGWEGSTCGDVVSREPCSSDCGGATQGVCRGGECFCYPGYEGEGCEIEKKCPDDCNSHGECSLKLDAICVCEPGYEGLACEQALCPEGSNDCNGHGFCAIGECWCVPGWEGFDCLTPSKCKDDCSHRGACINGKCKCKPGYEGDNCFKPTPEHRSNLRHQTCPTDCSGHGMCVYGLINTAGESFARCECFAGWAGEECAENHQCKALDYCSGHGQCADEECVCDCGYGGIDCASITVGTEIPCPGGCSENGICLLGQCYCNPGYSGAACELDLGCPEDCNGHGVCKWGKCYCDLDFHGESCEIDACSGCSGHGYCCNGDCICQVGWNGESCDDEMINAPLCPNNCSDNGFCEVVNGLSRCNCYTGSGGSDCSQVMGDLDEDTALHSGGQRFIGSPIAFSELNEIKEPRLSETGAVVMTRGEVIKPSSLCAEGCIDNGVCKDDGTCSCNPGYEGPACMEVIQCKDNCNGRGVCAFGVCLCGPMATGESCAELADGACDSTCALIGQCAGGACHCFEGVIHPDCIATETTLVTAGAPVIPSPCASEDIPNNCSECEVLLGNDASSMARFARYVATSGTVQVSFSAVAIMASVACIAGLVSGLVVQRISSIRQRAQANAILLSTAEEDAAEDEGERVSYRPLMPAASDRDIDTATAEDRLVF